MVYLVALFILQTATFQVVLATDGDRTYVIFLYADGGIQFSGSGGHHAQVGISVGDMKETHPDSGTPDIIRVATGSNVNVPGKYIYRIDMKPSEYMNMVSYCYRSLNDLNSTIHPKTSYLILKNASLHHIANYLVATCLHILITWSTI